ncbi:hypothetical protein PRIC1_011165 [Phytophthora ramorum]
MEEETLRLQFGSAATTIGTQWLALEGANGVVKKPQVLAFEAKGRVRRQVGAIPNRQEDPSTWTAGVQVYDQSETASTSSSSDGLWDWARLEERHLVEVDEFRPHLPLHNFYEGRAEANGGSIGNATLEAAEDRVRTVLEACDQLRLVQTLVDMDSSWGGLAYEVMTYVAEECPGAVVMVVGNDWSYPMASDDAAFRVDPSVRDRTKVEARKRVNVASSVALLSEVAHLFLPVAMAAPTSRLRFDRSSCAEVSGVVATALELALSVHRSRSREMAGGFPSNMKVAALSASFPHTSDPTTLLRYVSDCDREVGGSSSDPLQHFSLLPAVQHEDRRNKTHYRRLHLRGPFANFASLRSVVENFAPSPRDVALQWSEALPLVLPATYRLQTLQNSSVDAISQLSWGSRAGDYLTAIAQRAAKSDKRTLFEFTRAGMSPDAPEELAATLAAMGDAYFAQ